MEFNRFDVSAKELVWDDPAACVERFLGLRYSDELASQLLQGCRP